jgi:hypothetical protein
VIAYLSAMTNKELADFAYQNAQTELERELAKRQQQAVDEHFLYGNARPAYDREVLR